MHPPRAVTRSISGFQDRPKHIFDLPPQLLALIEGLTRLGRAGRLATRTAAQTPSPAELARTTAQLIKGVAHDPAGMFADMYPSPNGCPSYPPQVLSTVVVLQVLDGLSDAETVQEVRYDQRWKAACGLGLLDGGFDFSLLTYFRRRLQHSRDPSRLFTAVRQVVGATGILRSRQRRALESTAFQDAVATQDTVTQLVSAIRQDAREVPGGTKTVKDRCTGPGKSKIARDDESARSELATLGEKEDPR
jgi:hypothetical protein